MVHESGGTVEECGGCHLGDLCLVTHCFVPALPHAGGKMMGGWWLCLGFPSRSKGEAQQHLARGGHFHNDPDEMAGVKAWFT